MNNKIGVEYNDFFTAKKINCVIEKINDVICYLNR